MIESPGSPGIVTTPARPDAMRANLATVQCVQPGEGTIDQAAFVAKLSKDYDRAGSQ